MVIVVEIDNIVGSGPFEITWGGYVLDPGGPNEKHYLGDSSQNSTPLVASVEKWQLLSGFTFSALDGITRIRVSERAPCSNYLDIDILSDPDDAIVVEPALNIKIIGSSVPGYPSTPGYTMAMTDIDIYTVTGAFVNGNAQFDVEGSGIFGGTTFPTGTAMNDDLIPVGTAGNYKVTLDAVTANYSFELI
jgi:hypothetical protein